MTRRRNISMVGIGLSVLSLCTIGRAALSSATDSRVSFEAAGPAGMKIDGTTPDLVPYRA